MPAPAWGTSSCGTSSGRASWSTWSSRRPIDGSDPLENYDAIRAELVQYDARLGERPEIVAVTKAELPGAAGGPRGSWPPARAKRCS